MRGTKAAGRTAKVSDRMGRDMTDYERYGVYFLPPEGALADFGAAWLGWDIAQGRAVAHPEIAPLPASVADLSATPRRYGFHATIKPPFRLASGADPDDLDAAMAGLCKALAPIQMDGLMVSVIKGFAALVPVGDTTSINGLAAEFVRALDEFRAPPEAAELARRRRRPLTERQEANLIAWGYPHVMADFGFHMTLTGRVPNVDMVVVALAPRLAPLLPAPFPVDALCLVGEDAEGFFHLIHRYPLTA